MPAMHRLKDPKVWAICLGAAVAVFFVATRWLAVFAEAINWDEFALLERADRSLRFGIVDGGGRPGLVTILLGPFVRNCVNSVDAVVKARIFWQFVTIVYLAGVYLVVRQWIVYSRDTTESRGDGILAVALLVFLPAFVAWSIQVRTDQVALAAGIWGGVLLMMRRTPVAIGAGALFGVAILATQKGLYVIALSGVMFLTASASRALSVPGALGRELMAASSRVALAVAGMVLVIGGYYLLFPSVAELVGQRKLVSAVATMDWYRDRLGFRVYTAHAGRLWVHWIFFFILLLSTWIWIRRRDRDALARLATCWAVLALGLVVAVVHGSRFAYFLMTAGLFPAVALALAAGPALARFGSYSHLVIAGLVVVLAATSAPEALEMVGGTQARQRETMRLINGTPLRNMRGYQVEGALFCMRDPEPLPVMFSQQIARRRMTGGPHAFDSMVDEFRARPIAYIVESYRMSQFSLGIRTFWEAHYVPYAASVLVAGFRISGDELQSTREVIVAGNYRWIPDAGRPAAPIQIDGRTIAHGDVIHLDTGPHRVSRSRGEIEGLLVLAPGEAMPSEIFPFYDELQRSRLSGYR